MTARRSHNPKVVCAIPTRLTLHTFPPRKIGALETSERGARFRTAIHLIINGQEVGLDGICNGHIARLQSGTAGFGYDPIFIPKGEDRTFSEMSSEEKNSMSHRGSAIRSMLEYLGV